MRPESHYTRNPLFIGIGFLLFAMLAEFTAIMLLNHGVFVYILDDAYIHLALSENIRHGHYGLNLSEFCSPSSSILWPFLIAPFSSFESVPLIVNAIFAILTVFIYTKILDASLPVSDKRIQRTLASSLAILLVVATNVVGLVFTGMEHSAQLLLVSIICWGLIVEAQENKAEPWLLAAIAAAPLIRYENLAISLTALGYLFLRKYYKSTACALIVIALPVAGFSMYLTHLGLRPFPMSVIDKSTVVASGGKLESLAGNLKISLTQPRGMVLALGALAFASFAVFARQDRARRQLAAAAAFAPVMHLFAGRYGWGNRYEVYVWAYLVLLTLYLIGGLVARRLEGENARRNLNRLVIFAIVFFMATGPWYVKGLFTMPLASNNIYQQQYQMRRFAVDYHGKPVAVNDIGYVSYKNSEYVLDLGGLASVDVLEYRERHQHLNFVNQLSAEWMNEIARSKDIELAMLYEEWFENIPEDWIKIGVLRLGRMKITPAFSDVAFYALNQNAYVEILAKLESFSETLPGNAEFIFEENRG